MQWMVVLALVLVGLSHLLPLIGLLGAPQLEALYGITIADPSLAVLMRHRALMLGLQGALMLLAAFVPPLRLWALLVGLLSAGSFTLLAWSTAGANANVGRVAMIDAVAVLVLLAGLAAWFASRRPANSA